MKIRAWQIVLTLVCVLSMIPLGVTAQESQSWDTYQTTWTQINYQNISTVWIQHPVNGSMVSNNQKLNFIVVPFDSDELLYTVNVFKNNIHMYTCNQEQVYDLDIYTTNPINQIVTIIFQLNDKEVLRLEYLTILTTPSLDQDYTEQWLAYQAQKGNESLSGKDFINRRDQALRDINLVMMTGFWSLILTVIAIMVVLVFQLINVVNLFSGIVWFLSGFLWVGNMNKLEQGMRSLSTVTPDDLFVYYASIITYTLIIVIANLFYIISYKATSTRLDRKQFRVIDKKNRNIRVFDAVVGRSGKGKMCWRLQDSFSAIRRVLFRADYEFEYDRGNINDTFQLEETKEIPENIDIRKAIKRMKQAFSEIYSRITFKVVDPETGEIIPSKDKEKSIDYDIWKTMAVTNPLSKPTPIIFIDGEPKFRREYNKEEYDNIIEQMKRSAKESSDPEFVKKLDERIKKITKTTKKPERYIVDIKLANAEVYDLLDWQTDCKTFDNQAKKINELKDEIHEKERKLIVMGYEAGEDIYAGFDKTLEDWEKGTIDKEG